MAAAIVPAQDRRLPAGVAGKIVKAGGDNLHVAHTIEFTSGDSIMDLDKPVFTGGILPVDSARNDVSWRR